MEPVMIGMRKGLFGIIGSFMFLWNTALARWDICISEKHWGKNTDIQETTELWISLPP